jgi:RHS repeat-associated protein
MTLLPDGRWLVLGGWHADGFPAAPAVLESNGSLSRTLAAGLNRARAGHTATMLPDGSVIVIGGIGRRGELVGVVERFDPVTETFETVGEAPPLQRAWHSSTLLTDGRLVIAGGRSAGGESSEIFVWDPERGLPAGDVTMASLRKPRSRHAAELVVDGTVRLSGGADAGGGRPVDEVFDPISGTSSVAAADNTNVSAIHLAASQPSLGAVDVPIDSRLSVRFSAAVDVRSITDRTVTLADESGALPVTLVPAEGGRLLFVRPLGLLSEGTEYRLSLDGIVGTRGARLESVAVTFTTAGERRADGQPLADDESWAPDVRAVNGWRTGRGESPWQRLPPLRARDGVTAVSGQLLRLNGQPLPNALLKVGARTATSDRTGRFLIEFVESGRSELLIDARPAGTPGRSYGVFRVGLDVIADRTNVLPFTSWIPRLDTQNAVRIASPTVGETTITTPLIPGLEVRLPPGTIIRDVDGNAARDVSITPIPVNRTPFPLPTGVRVPIYFTIQPGGAYLEGSSAGWPSGARVIYPNYHALRPGTEVDFWHYDPEERGWFVYGLGAVRPDGRRIEPRAGVSIYEFTGAMVGDPSFGPAEGPPPCAECEDGDPVDLATGLFVYTKTDLALPDVTPLALTRTYRPRDTRSRVFGIGSNHPYDIFIVGDTNPWTYADIVMADGSRIHFPRISPGTNFNSAVYEHTESPSMFFKSKISWNSQKARWDLRFPDGSLWEFPEAEFAPTPAKAALLSMQDRFGNKVTLTRDTNARLTRITSPNGRTIDLTYDGSDRITQAKDNAGRTIGYQYDASGRLWKVTDVASGVTEYTYDASHRMKTIKDPRGIVFLTNDYDLNGRVIRQTQADGSTFQFAYTISGGLVTQTEVTDPRGFLRRVTFNPKGYWLTDISAVGRPEQQSLTVLRDPVTNFITRQTDDLNRRTDFGYDAFGNLESVTRLAGTGNAVTTTADYEPDFQQLASVTDPLLHSVTYGYDTRGALTTITDHLGHSVSVTSDTAGQPTSLTNAAGTAQLQYQAGDLTGILDGNGQLTRRLIDGAGRELRRTDALGNVTRAEYNAFNQPTRIVDALDGETAATYDGNGNVLTITDARTGVTEYAYDVMDRVETRKDPLLQIERYTYDRAGNLVQLTDRRGVITTYKYDGLNRLTQALHADGSTVTYTYDAGDRLRQVVDSQTGTILLDYDDLDRLTSETTLQGVISYGYDAADRRTSMTVTGQTAVIYGYDAADRLTSITQGSTVVGFEYDDANRRTALVLPNGVRVEYGYTSGSQLAGLTYKLGQTVLGTLSYTYDAAGRRTTVTGSWARTLLPAELGAASYNAANRLTQWDGAALTYDGNGNLLSDGARTYSWDVRNRLSAIGGATPATFQYDGLGRRTSKSTVAGTKEYLHDGIEPVQERVGGSPTANLLYGGGVDELLMRTDGAGARFLVADGLGSALALLDPAGVLQTRYTYGAFGTAAATGEGSGNTAQFTGRDNDGTGLHYYRARYYNPRLQRFISEDPLDFEAGDTNLYAYVGSSPTNWIDPLGLERTYPNRGNLPGTNVPYRVDMNQQPHPNMHVKWPDGSQTVINNNGGWERTHGGKRCVKPPKKYRQALRKVAKQFVKKAGRAIPVLGLVLLAADVAEAATVLQNPNAGIGDLVNIVVPYKDVADMFNAVAESAMPGRKDP